MPPDHQNQIFGVHKPLSTRVQLSRQEIELLREIVTYASTIPETTPWNALFLAYDAVLRKKGIDAALDDRCFRFLMRLAEVQGTSWYDRYASLLSMWHYEVPPEVSPYTMNSSISFSSGQLSANIGPITITFKGNRQPNFSGRAFKALPNPRIQALDDNDGEEYQNPVAPALRSSGPGKENIRVNNGRSSPHPSLLQRRKLQPSDGERRRREELERMKAEFAFPTSLFETTSEVEGRPADEPTAALTRASFLNQEDLDDQNDENESPENTAYIPSIRDKAGLIAAAEQAVLRFNNRRIAFAGEILKHWRAHAYRVADYHQLQWELACYKHQRILASQVFDLWRTGLYWKALERRVTYRRQQAILSRCINIWRVKAVQKAQRKAVIDRNMLMRKVFRAWKSQAQDTANKIRRFQLANALRKWRQRLGQTRAMEEVAQRRYDGDLKYRAYWTLFYGFCNIRAPQLNELRLKRFAMKLMERRIGTLKETERIADDLYCFSLLKKYFRMWRGDLTWIQDISAKADEERRYMLLYKGVLTWRREARYAPLVRQQQGIHDANEATTLIALWRNRLRQIRAADHVNKINVQKNILRVWRHQARLRQHRKYVKSVYLSTWFDRYSAALAIRCHQYQVWRRWLWEWRHRLHRLRAAEDLADEFASLTVHRTVKLEGIVALRARYLQVQDMECKADEFRKNKLLRAAFSNIVQKKRQLEQMETWAMSADYFLGAKKLLKVWQQTMDKRKRQYRKEAYNRVVRNRALRIKMHAYNALLTKHEAVASLNVTAQDFFDSGCRVQVTDLLVGWRERVQDIRELQAAAVDFRQSKLMAVGIAALLKKLHSIYELYHLGGTYDEIARKDKMANTFKKLRNAQFHHKLDLVKADMFRDRAEANRKKTTFRSWYWASREKLERQQINDQLNRELLLENQRQLEEYKHMEAADNQLIVEQRLHARRRRQGESEAGDRSILRPEGLSMLDVSEWVHSNSAANLPVPSTITRIPQTPSARAARARALLEIRNTVAPVSRLKLASTTPLASPSRKFSQSIAPFRRSISGKTDLRFTQSLSSRLRQEIKEVDEDESSISFLKPIEWDENEQPSVDEYDHKMGGSTAVATLDSPR